MSLVRGFTKRLQRTESKRPTISGPVHLISSTNVASYNAPDIKDMKISTATESAPSQASPHSSRTSSDRNYHSDSPTMTEPTLTDASSVETSPVASPAPEKNQKTAYFPTKSEQNTKLQHYDADSTLTTHVVDYAINDSPPSIPRRAPSHSKREHVKLARKRSVRSMNETTSSGLSSPAPELDPEHTPRPQHQSTPPMQSHPFGRELQQLNEVAEEFERDTREYELDVDLCVMERLGLGKFSADDYLCLIVDPLSPGGMFADEDYRESCWI